MIGFRYKSGVIGVAARSLSAKSALRGASWCLPGVVAALSLTACSTAPRGDERPLGHLTASLSVSRSLEMSRLSYQDACGNRRDFALGPALEEAFRDAVAAVFQGQPAPGGEAPPRGVDRFLEIDADAAELILFVEQGTPRRYPANVSLAVIVTAYDASGTLLDRHRLGANVSASVYTEGDGCIVRGAEQVAAEAVETLAGDLARYLQASQAIALGTVSPAPPAASATLTFRARLQDADGNQVLEGEEEVTLEVEVTNVGSGPARGVRATLSGTHELVRQLPPVIAFGDLQPGQSKRQAVTARLGKVVAAGRAELIVSLQSRSVLRQRPASKKFLIMVQPKHTASRMPYRKPVDRAKGS